MTPTGFGVPPRQVKMFNLSIMPIWACWTSHFKTIRLNSLCDYNSHCFSGKAFYKILEYLFRMCAQSAKSICEVRHCCWWGGLAGNEPSYSAQWCSVGLRSGLGAGQSGSFTPDSSNHVFMDYFACKGTVTPEEQGSSPNCCQNVGSAQLAQVSFEALRKPFTGTKGLSLNPDKQP